MSENSIAGIAKFTLSSRTTKRVRNRAGSIATAVNFIGPQIITRDEIAGEDCAAWFLTRHNPSAFGSPRPQLVLLLLHRGGIMKRLLTLLAVMVIGAVGVRTQQPIPYLTGPFVNG